MFQERILTNWKRLNSQKHEYEGSMIHAHSVIWTGHIDFAYDLILNCRPETIVELGTHWGRSFFSMAQASKDLNLLTKLYAVDSWKGNNHTGGYSDEVWDFVNKIKSDFYIEQAIHFLRKTFDEAVDEFKDKSIDILHIDGYHTYEAV